MTAVAPLAFLVPMLGAGVAAVCAPLSRPRLAVAAAAIATLAAAALCAVLLAHASGDPIVAWLGGWRPRHGAALGIDLAVDGLGAGLALFSAALAVVATILSARLIVAAPAHYHAVALLFVAAMVAFCLTGDLFNLFVFFELMSVAAYVLVGYEVRQRAPLEGALTFAVTNTAGSILMLFGIGLLYGQTGALNLAQIGQAVARSGADATTLVAFGLIAVGLLVKTANVPFHFWVADAYAVAPTPVCILLAGVYSELGLYGLARVWWTAFDPALGGHAATLRVVLVALGAATGLLGGAMALAQHHLKRMLAWVTIAQIGAMTIGVGLLTAQALAGVAVFLVGDGLAKAALFVAIAVVQHRYDAIDVGDLHGRARELPLVAAAYLVAALAIAGLPPLGSFAGRAIVEDAALALPGWAWVPAVLAAISALSAAPVLRAGARVFAGWGAPAPRDGLSEERRDEQETADESSEAPRATSPWAWAPAVALVAAALAWGLLPGLGAAAARAAAAFVDPAAYAHAVLGTGRARPPVVPAVHGPGATALLYAAASTLAGLAIAAAGLRRMPGPRLVAAAVDRVRALHSGHPGDYLAWALAGAALLTGVLVLAMTP